MSDLEDASRMWDDMYYEDHVPDPDNLPPSRVVIPRAQHEALMAAKDVLVRLCGAASPEDWSAAIRVLAALRAAGIDPH